MHTCQTQPTRQPAATCALEQTSGLVGLPGNDDSEIKGSLHSAESIQTQNDAEPKKSSKNDVQCLEKKLEN